MTTLTASPTVPALRPRVTGLTAEGVFVGRSLRTRCATANRC